MASPSKYGDEKQNSLYKIFPSTHFLSQKHNLENVLLWSTFFRRNLHRLAIDYLGINLHLYQAILLYMMGVCHFIVVIASRAAAKSFLIALYACCRCIIRPNTWITLSSGTKNQSKLIVTAKIKNELMGMSPALRREIRTVKDNQNEVIIFFHNGSTITVVPASENGRGNRSTSAIREEFRQIAKKVDDSIISPFQIVRQVPYMTKPPYNSIKELQEEPVDVYISSSWYDDGHWMWGVVDQAKNDMLNGGVSCLLAFDESVVLKHNIKTLAQLKREKKKQDPMTWRIEFLNERVKQNASAFFDFKLITQNQIVKRPFYPRTTDMYKSNKKNPFVIPKQNGEIRVVSCDMAFVAGDKNDNSVYSCIRALPETMTHYDDDGFEKAIVKHGYRRTVPYIESHPGGDTTKQAVRIRQLYEDFQADYIVLDMRNGGVQVFYSLAKVLYDDIRGVEYSPLTCMNDTELANSVKIEGAKPVIFAVSATQRLNSDIAYELRNALNDKRINFLENFSDAKETILSEYDEYVNSSDPDDQLFYEIPFLETQLFLSETSNLLYEKLEQTGAIKIYEQGGNKKDRYTSVSYGNYFISLLEKDLYREVEEVNYDTAPHCVSPFIF